MNILISLLRNNADSTKKKSESSGRERSPRWEHAIHGNSTQPYNVPKGFPHGHWTPESQLLEVHAGCCGFAFWVHFLTPWGMYQMYSPYPRRFIWVHSILCVARGCGLSHSLLEHKQQSKKENFFWIIELLPSGNTLSLWFWVCLVINKDIWEVLFARHQEFGIQGWDVDISPFKGWIELIHLSTQVAEHLLCAG